MELLNTLISRHSVETGFLQIEEELYGDIRG